MKTINKTITSIFLVAMLTSCVGSQSTPKTGPTIAMETAMAIVRTSVVETQIAQPSPTPTMEEYTPTPIPGLSVPVTPRPNQQVYTDPEGWYTVSFPADWKPMDRPNSFSGNSGFFETGYLPEMGYVTRAITICVWFANIEAEPGESEINWMPQETRKCSVTSKSDSYFVEYSVMENPGADTEHRFVYLKAGIYPSNSFSRYAHFSWTKPVYYESKFDPGIMPLSPAETKFWGVDDSMPSNISVTEYVLPPEGQVGPTEDMLLHFVPEDLFPEEWNIKKTNPTSTPYKKPAIDEQLKPLGYELKGDIRDGKGQQLFRDGRLLFDYVVKVSDVYIFSTNSGPITSFVVNTIGTAGAFQNSFLVENDAINVWEYGSMDYNYPPILYQDKLLWAKVNQKSQIEIKKSSREVIFTFETYFDAKLHMDNFRSWNGHWILEADSFVVQDGEILNEKFDYQEVFSNED